MNRNLAWQRSSLVPHIDSNCTVLCRPVDGNDKSQICSPHLISSEVFAFHFLITVASLSFEQEKNGHTWFDTRNNFALKSKQNLLRKCMITHLCDNQHQVDRTGLVLLSWWVPWLKVTNIMINKLYMHANIHNIWDLKIVARLT